MQFYAAFGKNLGIQIQNKEVWLSRIKLMKYERYVKFKKVATLISKV